VQPESLVIPLKQIGSDHASVTGNKAYKLSLLMQQRGDVPNGFCLSSQAYAQHLREHKLEQYIQETVNNASPERSGQALTQIRDKITAAPMADSIGRMISSSYSQLNCRSVAVRSSATAEDLPGHSFAGQYETVLSVSSLDQCLNAVKQCWASVWTERAYAYRVQNGLAHEQINMAVIIQQQIEPEWAGVIFTAHPISGSPSRIIIEACPGLGEALVSGQVEPNRYVIRKKNLFLLHRQIVHNDAQHSPLRPKTIKKLARVARRIERQFGCVQDIEWAVRHGRIYILQARPVTTHIPSKQWADRQVWSNLNLAEVVPDVTTPLTWSVLGWMLERLFQSIYGLFGADIRRHPVADLVAGRLYFNLNTAAATITPFMPLMPKDFDIDTLMGGHQNKLGLQGELDFPDEDLPDMGFNWIRYILSWPRIVYGLITHSPKTGTQFLRRLSARSDQLAGLNVDSMTPNELVQTLLSSLLENRETWDLLFLVTGATALPVLKKACQDWVGDKTLQSVYRLFAAQGGMGDTQAGLDLWSLAALAHQDRQTEAVLLSGSPWDRACEQLQATESGQGFVHAWHSFMQEHGHHCRGELELFNARWSERPDYILGLVRSYLKTIEQADPLQRQAQLAREREALTDQCRTQLKNPLKRHLFNWSLKQAQQLSRDRENWKNQAIRQVAAWRRIYQALGAQLAQTGTLHQRDDIFFLKMDEIEPVVNGTAEFPVAQTINQRRAEYEQNLSYCPPPIVLGRFDPRTQPGPSIDQTIRQFRGIGASAGVVTGRARVILRTDDEAQINPGEILVAPFTDPAWTPYFIPAAAVVMDQGGLLSHGSIIAREYGIPAVVNVGPATKIIKTGQPLHVDANQGLVTLMDNEEGPQGEQA
jgi:rifampicin phosphotransferase